MRAAPQAPIAVFGGTFDPVHNGHLRSALELAEQLQLAEVRMMPCANPPHRAAPQRDAQHRASMVELAVAGEPLLSCDRRELARAGRSYTIDSLIELREEVGQSRSISLLMGCDAVLSVTSWHRWDELLDWAHIIVIARPGWQLPREGPVARWMADHASAGASDLRQRSAGSILVKELRPLSISASEIRELVANGHSARFLMPDSVLDYILKHRLYGTRNVV